MSKNLVTSVKIHQVALSQTITDKIIVPLLLESKLANPLSEDTLVKFKFPEIDVDLNIKLQNHAVDLFTKQAITHAEMRMMLGKKPLKEGEEEGLMFKMIQQAQQSQDPKVPRKRSDMVNLLMKYEMTKNRGRMDAMSIVEKRSKYEIGCEAISLISNYRRSCQLPEEYVRMREDSMLKGLIYG